MKNFNLKFMSLIILTLLLQGCMPDSMTKFSKEAPKKAAPPPLASPIQDSAGNAVDPSTIDFPTDFFYISKTEVPTKALVVGTEATISPSVNGSLADPSKRNLIFLRCELDKTAGTANSQTAPHGMIFDSSTCVFKGTPQSIYTDAGSPVLYTVNLYYKNASGIESKLSTTIKIGVFLLPKDLLYSQNDRLTIKTTPTNLSTLKTNVPTADYDRAGIFTSIGGVSGVVKFVDTIASQIGVVRAIPLVVDSTANFTVNGDISASGGVQGKVLKIDNTNPDKKIIYVETFFPDKPFVPGNIDNTTSYSAPATATILSVESNYYQTTAGANSADNDMQYYSNNFTINEIVQTYEVGATITDIVPINTTAIAQNNGIVYSISPALPNANINSPDLNFNTATGKISGKFTNTLMAKKFTITATNPVGSTSTTVTLEATLSPKNLSYTTRELITVNSSATFLENEAIFQPITPPLTANVKGRIIRKFEPVGGPYKLSIDTFNGAFLSGASLDSGRNYYSEKAYIDPVASDSAINYNLALTVVSVAGFAPGDIVTGQTSGATARVVGKDSNTNTLFLQFLAPSIPVKTFIQGESIGSAITQIESNNMILTLAAGAAYTKGQDISTNGVNILSGYIYDVNGSIISVSDITKKAGSKYFFNTQTASNNEIYASGVVRAITNVTHDNFYIVERGIPFEIQMNLSQGSGVSYSSSPALPSGVTISTTTGKISGTPTGTVPRKDYVITAQNLLGSSTFVLSLEVRDYFKITENSGATSFILHKFGDSEHYRDCKINTTDILSSNGVLDVRCFLDGEEEDLHFTKLNLSAAVGKGVCEYIQYVPFNFNQYAPLQTGTVAVPVVVADYVGDPCGDAIAPGGLSPWVHDADRCYGNYAMEDGPNCDEGAWLVTTTTYTKDPVTAACNPTSSTAQINCGGNRTNCLQGPIRDLLSTEQINHGNRSMIYASSEGAAPSWTLTAPIEKLDNTNLRVANGSVKNTCSMQNSDVSTLEEYYSDMDPKKHPFGKSNPFYTFNCLDAAREIKARIRLVIRDWDKTFKINDSLDVSLPALMNVAGSSPFGESYDYFMDWDGAYNGTAVNYAGSCGGSCSDVTYLTKKTCEEAGEDWTSAINTTAAAAYCYDPTKITKVTCEAVGGNVWVASISACSTTIATKSGCLGADYIWSPYIKEGSCTDVTKLTKVTCEAAGAKWITNYKFPKDSI